MKDGVGTMGAAIDVDRGGAIRHETPNPLTKQGRVAKEVKEGHQTVAAYVVKKALDV
jgi:hypothetical protein